MGCNTSKSSAGSSLMGGDTSKSSPLKCDVAPATPAKDVKRLLGHEVSHSKIMQSDLMNVSSSQSTMVEDRAASDSSWLCSSASELDNLACKSLRRSPQLHIEPNPDSSVPEAEPTPAVIPSLDLQATPLGRIVSPTHSNWWCMSHARHDVGADVDVMPGKNPNAEVPGLEAEISRQRTGKRLRSRTKSLIQMPPGEEEEYLGLHKIQCEMGEDTRQLIRTGMKQDMVFWVMEEEEIETILESMEYFEFKSDEPVVKQGDVGNMFFVIHEGSMSVSVDGEAVNSMSRGEAFGGLALLYNCPRTASVTAMVPCGVWGANGDAFRMLLQENAKAHHAWKRELLESLDLFNGFSAKQKDRVGELFCKEVFDSGMHVVTEGKAGAAMYFVKKGILRMLAGATVDAQGKVLGGTEHGTLSPGDCFGERSLLYEEPWSSTIVADGTCELFCVTREHLVAALGIDLCACLERHFVLSCLKKSPFISQLESSQQSLVLEAMETKTYKPGEDIKGEFRFVIVVDGVLEAQHGKNKSIIHLHRGDYIEDHKLPKNNLKSGKQSAGRDQEWDPLFDMKACRQKATRLSTLSKGDMERVFKELGIAGSADESKMLLARKVPIFRHLSVDQRSRVIRMLRRRLYEKGETVFQQGDTGEAFYLIANGEVRIDINGKPIRTLASNAYFGERALLFQEPRSATVEVMSKQAELWYIEKGTFETIVTGNMMEELKERINRQDTNLSLKDLKEIEVIGCGAVGVVRLVEHRNKGIRYALKRVMKENDEIPEEVQRECDLLKGNYHPFIMELVEVFETKRSVYLLTELITGGELHAAIRKIPDVLSRSQAQFYAGSLVLVLEALADQSIVFRDLKPENVMLDHQGYLKLIDFGIAKKVDERVGKTFTMIGTPHYMAPEVMRGHGYSTEVDIWSLGVMLFEFVCGELPFADELDELVEVCAAVLTDALSFPDDYQDVHGKDLISAMLTREPNQRIGSSIRGPEDIKNSQYFQMDDCGTSLFNQIIGREITAPVVPVMEIYGDPEDLSEIVLSDADEFA